jgi:hypothetical protein
MAGLLLDGVKMLDPSCEATRDFRDRCLFPRCSRRVQAEATVASTKIHLALLGFPSQYRE